jgi:hypothetical protein
MSALRADRACGACCSQIMASLGLFDEDVALAALLRTTRGAAGGGKGGGGKSAGGRKRAAAGEADADADAGARAPERRSRRVAGLVRRCVARTRAGCHFPPSKCVFATRTSLTTHAHARRPAPRPARRQKTRMQRRRTRTRCGRCMPRRRPRTRRATPAGSAPRPSSAQPLTNTRSCGAHSSFAPHLRLICRCFALTHTPECTLAKCAHDERGSACAPHGCY